VADFRLVAVNADLTPAEQRVLGSLLEKQRTTPDQYPLSLNALRLACNQSTNRDPVVDYDEETIRAALHGLGRRRFTRLASGHTSRASKYRHLVDEALGVDPADQAVLAVLLLRGPQTPGELKLRTERLYPFADLDAVEAQLESLMDRDLAARLERRPGQKEVRYAHLLGEDAPEAPAADGDAPEPLRVAAGPVGIGQGALTARVAALEDEVRELRAELQTLRAELGA
jgi:uncharacterized protein YceH (UPF0502 family)